MTAFAPFSIDEMSNRLYAHAVYGFPSTIDAWEWVPSNDLFTA